MAESDYVRETRRLLRLAADLTAGGDGESAVEAYRLVARRHPATPAGWRQLAVAAGDNGMTGVAVDALRKVLVLAPGDGDATRHLSQVETDFDPTARHRLRAAVVAANPGDARAVARLSISHQQRGQPEAAEWTACRALRLDPTLAETRLNLAVLLRTRGLTGPARQELRRAATLEPGLSVAWRRMAITGELLSDLPTAERAAGRALAIDPRDHSAAIVRAIVQRRTGRTEVALRGLQALPSDVVGEISRDAVEFELGTLNDLLGDADAAFDHFAAGNRLALARAPSGSADAGAYRAELRAHEAALAEPYLARWTPLEPVAEPPVFMVGFPRSGTTLLDQLLDCHPAIRVLEEQPVMSSLAARFGRPLADLPDRMADLTPAAAERWRSEHRALLRRIAGDDAPDLVIDKMPLNLAYAGLILRLYPNARLIVSLRHPCDCCLSCFMQPFRLNPAMANFVDLDGATRLYASVMGLWLRVRDRLRPDHVTVRYEDLIADIEGTARPVVDALGVGWDPAMLDHLAHARSRGLIRTPSFRQVTEPIYTRASGRWKRYRRHLEPYMDRLAPFIAEFGYASDAD